MGSFSGILVGAPLFGGGDLVDFTFLGAIGTYSIHPRRSPGVVVPLCSMCRSFPFSLRVLSMVGVLGSVGRAWFWLIRE